MAGKKKKSGQMKNGDNKRKSKAAIKKHQTRKRKKPIKFDGIVFNA